MRRREYNMDYSQKMLTSYILCPIKNHEIPLECYTKMLNLIPEIVKNKEILIKPNMGFPANPLTCTNPNFLLQVCQLLLDSGAKKILIGDTIPQWCRSLASISNISQVYSAFGYNILNGLGNRVYLIDLWKELSYERIKLNEEFAVRVISGPEVIISVSLPKVHSEAIFSGCAKNLMGLVHPDDVIVFHSLEPTHAESRYRDLLCMTESEREAFKGLVEKLGLQTIEEIDSLFSGLTLKDNSYYFYVDLLSKGLWRNILRDFSTTRALSIYLQKLKMLKLKQSYFLQKRINEFLEYILHNGTYLGLLDATFLIAYEQHAGKPIDLGFVAFSVDPRLVDKIALKLIGMDSPHLHYLNYHDTSLSADSLSLPKIDFEKICYPIGWDAP